MLVQPRFVRSCYLHAGVGAEMMRLILSKMRCFWISPPTPRINTHTLEEAACISYNLIRLRSIWAAGGSDNGVDGSAESSSCGFRRSPGRHLFCWLWMRADKQGTKNHPWRMRARVGDVVGRESDGGARQRLLNLTTKGIKPHSKSDWFPPQSRWCSTGYAW